MLAASRISPGDLRPGSHSGNMGTAVPAKGAAAATYRSRPEVVRSMKAAHSFHVHPAIPERLACLRDLAYNLRWTWDHDTIELFTRLDASLWNDCGHNPVLLLNIAPQTRLEEAAADDAFLAHLDRVCAAQRAYLTEPGWFRRRHPQSSGLTIAYFSMEFGLTECLPNYSGGLGVLSGDHLKSASHLDILSLIHIS